MLGIACLLSHFLSANVQCFVDAGLLWTSVRTLSMLGSSERCSMRYNFLMGVSKTLLLASRAIRPPKRLARQTWILSRPRERERAGVVVVVVVVVAVAVAVAVVMVVVVVVVVVVVK